MVSQMISPTRTERICILAGQLFDPTTLQLVPSRLITVNPATGLITDVVPSTPENVERVQNDKNTTVFDLHHLVVLPGFVDVHVHMFLHSYGETSWDDQLTKESLAERTIRATVHAKKTLEAGFTAVRDLGTEGAFDADIALRKCLSGPDAIIPGPRYFCSSRAIVASGSYGPKSNLHPNQEGIEGVQGAEVADGIDGCVKAVRRQIGAGADWIKIYADYRPRSRMMDVSSKAATRDISTFTHSELEAMISTAHSYGVKVAVHAQTLGSFRTCHSLGVDSIEHSIVDLDIPIDDIKTMLLALMNSKTTWVPTLSVFYAHQDRAPGGVKKWESVSRMFKCALELGMENIACGGDTGAFPHGENALEMKLMVKLGADWKKVLKWGTLGGWECIRALDWEICKPQSSRLGDNEVRFGLIESGWAADIIAVEGDLETDFGGTLDRIRFVMKGGKAVP